MATDGKLVLDLNGETIVPNSATLSLNFATDTWDDSQQAWIYGEGHICPHWQLDVTVEVDSGEDGAAAPTLCYLLDPEPGLPPPAEFPGLQFSDLENQRCEAWYGNDAPAIVDNVLRFGPWLDLCRIEIEWTGKYHDWKTKRRDAPFRLAGGIAFKGITAQVREESDAARFIRMLMPRVDPATIREVFGARPPGWESAPGDRRFRLPVTWTRAS